MGNAVNRTVMFTPVLAAGDEDMGRVAAGGSVYEWVRLRLEGLQARLPGLDEAAHAWLDQSSTMTDVAETIRVASDQAATCWHGAPAAVEMQQALAALWGTAERMGVVGSRAGQFVRAAAQHGRDAYGRFQDQAEPARQAEQAAGIRPGPGPNGQPAPTVSDYVAWRVFDDLNRAWDDEAQTTAPKELHLTFPFPERGRGGIYDHRRPITDEWMNNPGGGSSGGPPPSGYSAPQVSGGGSGSSALTTGPTPHSPPPPSAFPHYPRSPYDPGTALAGGGGGVPAGSGGNLGLGGTTSGGPPTADRGGGGAPGASGPLSGPGSGNSRNVRQGAPALSGGSRDGGTYAPMGGGQARQDERERERRYWLPEEGDTWAVPDPLPQALLMGEYRPPRPDDEDEDDDW
ncbi:MAG TPA: hypothetical protein VLJ59_02385 [Mycobacteriales bacterium]|nr:hypothetical protein [Mycobacteriales bacterium]